MLHQTAPCEGGSEVFQVIIKWYERKMALRITMIHLGRFAMTE
jgi:hypothetical protein